METRSFEISEEWTLNLLTIKIQKVVSVIEDSDFVFSKIVLSKRDHMRNMYSDATLYGATIYYQVPDTIMIDDKEYIKKNVINKLNKEDELPVLDINWD